MGGERAFSYDAQSIVAWMAITVMFGLTETLRPRPLVIAQGFGQAQTTGTGDNGDGLGCGCINHRQSVWRKFRIIETIQLRGMALENE